MAAKRRTGTPATSPMERDLFATPAKRRMYEQERLIIWTTEEILRVMEERGMSRADLARTLGISKASIGETLNGESNITLRKLADVAWALGGRMTITFDVPTPESVTKELIPRRLRAVAAKPKG
jgi:antitoxin component HigA of HigAB toxin-antitoxin module